MSRTPSDLAREAMCAAMRKAASKRVAGVTGNKRRRHYGHAASLVAACAAADRMPVGARWLTRMRADYARYPALRRELDGRLESM